MGQALSDRCRDLVVNGNAARNRDNRQAMLLAMRLKCAAAIWLLTEPWRHTKTNVAGLLESGSARLAAPIKTVIRRSIKLPMRASEWDLGDALPSMRFGSTT